MEPYWKESIIAAIEESYKKIPRGPRHDAALIKFMHEECNFAMEHADGSFMDHLEFCFEYSKIHFAKESPRVLLLHSILGVGTNYFPCTVDKIPILQNLLTPLEMRHVEAFPSILRLILRGDFLNKLNAATFDELSAIQGIDFFRVIDNKPISLDSAHDFWVHLNYQLIHLLDFLPLLDWKTAAAKDIFLACFIALYNILHKAKQLQVHLEFHLNELGSSSSDANANANANNNTNAISYSLSLGSLIANYVPAPIQMGIGRRQVAKFSKQIGHSLEFTLRTTTTCTTSSSNIQD